MSQPAEPTTGEQERADHAVNAADVQEVVTTQVQQTSTAPSGFFYLPPDIRNRIYDFVFVSKYPIYLVRINMINDITTEPLQIFSGPGCKSRFYPWSWAEMIKQLPINRTFCKEATGILYGRNYFIADDHDMAILKEILTRMGPNRASLLSHIRINFPLIDIESGPSGQVRLRQEALDQLRMVKECCPRLVTVAFQTLILLPISGYIFSIKMEPNVLREYFGLIDKELKTIETLTVVRVLRNHTARWAEVEKRVGEAMKDFRWVICDPSWWWWS